MEPHNGHEVLAGHGRKPCPPHGPHVVYAVGDTSFVARCLACVTRGPQRADSLETKLAFDESFEAVRYERLRVVHLAYIPTPAPRSMVQPLRGEQTFTRRRRTATCPPSRLGSATRPTNHAAR